LAPTITAAKRAGVLKSEQVDQPTVPAPPIKPAASGTTRMPFYISRRADAAANF
jgi:hypothetical protein